MKTGSFLVFAILAVFADAAIRGKRPTETSEHGSSILARFLQYRISTEENFETKSAKSSKSSKSSVSGEAVGAEGRQSFLQYRVSTEENLSIKSAKSSKADDAENREIELTPTDEELFGDMEGNVTDPIFDDVDGNSTDPIIKSVLVDDNSTDSNSTDIMDDDYNEEWDKYL